MFALKGYQERALELLAAYFRRAQETDGDLAFYELTRRQYHPAPGLPALPYVCLRVPTGGGKTVMACHAVGLATRELLRAERSVALWLAPTTAIVDQTLRALQDRRHPYREALEQSLGGPASVLTLRDALYLPRHALDADTCVIVSTLAGLRVQETDGRKVYESAGALMSHFEAMTREQEADLERGDGGETIFSLANVLRLRRPVVIMDEAHNARTHLSFETLLRFRPSCVVEFTATPETVQDPAKRRYASNVLCHVSAYELKAEDMIKMPLVLETQPRWQETVTAALRRREELERMAEAEQGSTGEALRPILLFQAQPKAKGRETLTAGFLKGKLLEEFGVPADQVRMATGEDWELDGVDLGSPDCDVRCVITVQKLREGWDCPAAYVLCSVAEMGAPTAVEQILGRIMRLPAATRKGIQELNQGYAYVASARFSETAERLKDGLVSIGFDRLEVERMVAPAQGQLFDAGTLFEPSTRAVQPSPAERGEQFAVPGLARPEQGALVLWEPEDFLPADWDLGTCHPGLSEQEFALVPRGVRGSIDVAENGLRVRYIQDVQDQLALLEHEATWTRDRLVNWLDRNIAHPDVPQAHSLVFLTRLVTTLEEQRSMALADLMRDRFRLRDSVERKIQEHREAARGTGLLSLLMRIDAAVVTPELCFRLDHHEYSPNTLYSGPYEFSKHYHPLVGELGASGDEFECAAFLDQLPCVKHWVRNLAKRPSHSFWLPTTTDRFYPDFVAELNDGRYLVLEYKGEHLVTADDAKEKAVLGKLWEDRSEGRCVFFQGSKANLQELEDRLR